MGFPNPIRIPDIEFAQRRSKAAQFAADAGLDGLLVVGRSGGTLDCFFNIHWLTRHYFAPSLVAPNGFWRAYGFDFLAMTTDGTAALASVGVNDPPVIDDLRLGLDVEQLAVDMIRDLHLGNARLGLVGSEVLPWTVAKRLEAEFPRLSLIPSDLLMAQARLTLSATECDMLRQSVATGCRIMMASLEAARPGATDGDVVAAGLAVAARSERTQHWNFAMTGRRPEMEYFGSMPSWDPMSPYEPGDMIHPDCYGFVDGYAYDIQRTLVIGARPTGQQAYVIDGAYDMMQTLGEALRDGITCRESYELGLRFMESRGYSFGGSESQSWELIDHFGHGFASGWDWPWLGIREPLADTPLKAPFAVTIELHWRGNDGRAAFVEDDWLVLPNGSENLSVSVPKSLD